MVNVTTGAKEGQTTLEVRGDLTFDTAERILEAFKGVSDATGLDFHLLELDELDLSGLQLLYALKRERMEAGQPLSFNGDEAFSRISRMAEFAGLPQLREG